MSNVLASNIRARIAAIGLTHARVAQVAGYERTAFSHHLSKAAPSADFVARVGRALDALEEAEQAAEHARRKVLDRHAATETGRRNVLAIRETEHRPQAHELRRGTGETPEAWHGAAS